MGKLLIVSCYSLQYRSLNNPKILQVTYFKKWRVQDLKKKAQLKELEAQGANKMDVQTDFSTRS